MSRLLAGIGLVLACLHAGTMFAGAYNVSLRTDWDRLGYYLKQEVRALVTPSPEPSPATTTQPETKPMVQHKTIFIDSKDEETNGKTRPSRK